MSNDVRPTLNFAQTQTALDLIYRKGKLRTTEVSEALELNEARVRKTLNGLVDEGLLEVVVQWNNRYFRKPQAPEVPYVGQIAAPREIPKFHPITARTREQLARVDADGKARRIGA
jgi:hypothetical protein